jgi:hypothetical protein
MTLDETKRALENACEARGDDDGIRAELSP